MILRLISYMKKERSGLAYTTLELAAALERLGHQVCIQEPQGNVLYGDCQTEYDVEQIHSQLPLDSYHNGKPRFLWLHGEPISSVGNGVSMKAILDLAPLCNAMICMRKEEHDTWSTIKKTHLVPKGIDLDRFKPQPITSTEKLSGSPAVLYYENWRGSRNPLPLVIAMKHVWKAYPNARLHLYNCNDKRMFETFQSLIKEAKLWPFVRSLQGAVKPDEVPALIGRADIVVSCLYPLYARSIEALGVGRGFLCPGYTDPEYPFHCTLDPVDMSKAIIDLWENGCGGKFDFRAYAEKKHDVMDMARQAIRIYERYLDGEKPNDAGPEGRGAGQTGHAAGRNGVAQHEVAGNRLATCLEGQGGPSAEAVLAGLGEGGEGGAAGRPGGGEGGKAEANGVTDTHVFDAR